MEDLLPIEGGLDPDQVSMLLKETYLRLRRADHTYDVDGQVTIENQHPVKKIGSKDILGVDSVRSELVRHNPNGWMIDRAYRYKKYGIHELTGWDIERFLSLPPESVEEWFEVAVKVKAMEASDRKRAEQEAKRQAELNNRSS